MVNNLFAGKDSMYFLYRRLVTKMKKDGLEDGMDNLRPDENEESMQVESPKIPWAMILFTLAGWVLTLFMIGRINRSGLSVPELMKQAPVMVILLAVGIVLMFISLIWFFFLEKKAGKRAAGSCRSERSCGEERI